MPNPLSIHLVIPAILWKLSSLDKRHDDQYWQEDHTYSLEGNPDIPQLLQNIANYASSE